MEKRTDRISKYILICCIVSSLTFSNNCHAQSLDTVEFYLYPLTHPQAASTHVPITVFLGKDFVEYVIKDSTSRTIKLLVLGTLNENDSLEIAKNYILKLFAGIRDPNIIDSIIVGNISKTKCHNMYEEVEWIVHIKNIYGKCWFPIIPTSCDNPGTTAEYLLTYIDYIYNYRYRTFGLK